MKSSTQTHGPSVVVINLKRPYSYLCKSIRSRCRTLSFVSFGRLAAAGEVDSQEEAASNSRKDLLITRKE